MAVTPWAISSGVSPPALLVPIMSTATLGSMPVELAVLNPPEDVLGPVAADAEVGRVARAVEPLPDRRCRSSPG